MANLGEQIQLHNTNGTAVNPNMWITINRTGYTQSGTNIIFNFQAVLSIKISTGTYYNNKIHVKLQVPNSTNGANWAEYEIKPKTSGTPASTYIANSNGWVVPMSVGAFPINVVVWDAQNSSWTTGTYTVTSDMPIVVTKPSVGDLSFSNITSNSATASFSVTNTGYGTISGYQFDVTTDSSFQTGVASHTPSSPSIGLTMLTRYTTYWVRSRASNEAGWSDWNSAKSFTTLPTAPILSAVSVDKISFGSARASFSIADTGGPAISSNTIQISTNSNFSSVIGTINGTSGTFTSLIPNTVYYIRAISTNGSNLTSTTATVKITTKVYTPPSPPATGEFSLFVKDQKGGPDENGNLVEPTAKATYTATWQWPTDWGSATSSDIFFGDGGSVSYGVQIQWFHGIKQSNGTYTYKKVTSDPTTHTYNTIAAGNTEDLTINRSDFKPEDTILFKIRSYSSYKASSSSKPLIYYGNEIVNDGWEDSNEIQLVVERFIRLFKSSGNFKYERIYISKNGGNFTELEKDQTFKTI